MPQVGQGILKGMGVTLRHLFGKKITRQYPEYKRDLPERSRGMLTVDMDRCIACLQCMRICPDHCISIEQEKRDADGSGKAKPYAVGLRDRRLALHVLLAVRRGLPGQLHLPHRGVRGPGVQPPGARPAVRRAARGPDDRPQAHREEEEKAHRERSPQERRASQNRRRGGLTVAFGFLAGMTLVSALGVVSAATSSTRRCSCRGLSSGLRGSS